MILKHNSTIPPCILFVFHNWDQSTTSKGLSTLFCLEETIQHGWYGTISHCRRSLSLQASYFAKRRLSIWERYDGDVCKFHTLSTVVDNHT